MKNYSLSFVVDGLELHYYQAELLLYSLEQNSSFTKENLVVQCTQKVDPKFIEFLEHNNYTYNYIEPYLDGKYCNKLQQLNYFVDKECDGVFLLDTDMYILDDFSKKVGENIAAKVVDAPNPPLHVLQRIYTSASLEEPVKVLSDWELQNNDTYFANCNGGFYFIPGNFLNQFNQEWRKWATWLYNNRDLFDNEAQTIHVDQVSFSLAVNGGKFPFEYLDANCNYPIHEPNVPKSLKQEESIYTLHFHRMLDDFGYIDSSKTLDPTVLASIEIANLQISEKQVIHFFSNFKNSSLKSQVQTRNLKDFEERLQELVGEKKKLKLFLHCGTPKTGTTSLQHFLYKNQNKLTENGIIYPDIVNDLNPPKHQWLVSCLMSTNFEQMVSYFERVVELAFQNGSKTIVLSTEGLYNHWWDFSLEAKGVLQIIGKFFNITPIICYREPVSFMRSYYVQNLKNPQIDAAECYGKDLSVAEMLDDPWFVKHLDYIGFITECEALFGKNSMKVIKHSKNFIDDFCQLIDVEISQEGFQNENLGFSGVASEVLRVVNRYNLDVDAKKSIVKHLQIFDGELKKHISYDVMDEDVREKIEKIFHLQKLTLENKFDLKF